MLTSTVVRLRAKQNGWLPRTMGEYGHATFLSLIREVAPELSQALHDASTRQPYTVSPLAGGKRDRRGMTVRADDSYWLRFTMLDPALYSVFSRYFAESVSFELALKLGEVGFEIEQVITSSQMDNWSGYTTFADLLSLATSEPIIPMRFFSLTAFSLGEIDDSGPRFSILPEHGRVFDSLLRRWNQFAEQSLGDPNDWQEWIGEHIVIRRYRTESDLWQFQRHPQIGFIGECTYEVKGNHVTETRLLNALADFAFYAGIGSRTTMGMGQARRLTPE